MNAHRIVIVGDYGVGRSSLGMRVMEKELPDHISYWGLIEGDPIQVPCFNKIVELDIQVPMSSERYNRLLSLSYTAACAVVFCYSVEDPSSLEYVESQLWLEILHHNPKLPLILVGTKNDLSRKVAVDEARKVAARINAVELLECSSKTQEGIQNVVDAMARSVLMCNHVSNRLHSDRGHGSRGCVVT